MNICLKFTDEAQANEVLYTEHQFDVSTVEPSDSAPSPKVERTPNFRNIDTIGQITKLTGELDDQGRPITQTLDGWHVNVFIMPDEDGSALEAYTVYPSTPSRVWA